MVICPCTAAKTPFKSELWLPHTLSAFGKAVYWKVVLVKGFEPSNVGSLRLFSHDIGVDLDRSSTDPNHFQPRPFRTANRSVGQRANRMLMVLVLLLLNVWQHDQVSIAVDVVSIPLLGS